MPVYLVLTLFIPLRVYKRLFLQRQELFVQYSYQPTYYQNCTTIYLYVKKLK